MCQPNKFEDELDDIIVPARREDVVNPVLGRLFDDWLAAKGDADLPHPDTLDLLDYPEEARRSYLLDVIDEGKDFYCRFFGSSFVDSPEIDITGKKLSEYLHLMSGELIQTRAIHMLSSIVRERGPATIPDRQATDEGKEYIRFCALTLPYSHDGENVTRLFHIVQIIPDAA